MRSSLTFLLLVLIAATAHSQPVALPSVDPLRLPPPALGEPLTLVRDDRLPSEKITPLLWERLATAKADEPIRVLVLLQEPVLDRSLVRATPEWDAARLPRLAVLQHRFVAEARALGFEGTRGYSHLPLVAGQASGAALRRIAELRQVAAIEEDVIYKQTRVEGAALMSSNTLRTSFGGTGAGVGVAVIDSGVDDEHPELSSRVAVEADYTDTTGDGTIDGTGHGTGVAGIIAGSQGGIAPQAMVWALKVFRSDGTSPPGSVPAALNDAYAHRNDFGGLDVVNMSLGGTSRFNTECDVIFPAEAAAINQLVGAGIPVFVSSGNSGFVDGVSGPSCLSNAISVGAVYDGAIGPATFELPGNPQTQCTDTTTQADQITCYSNSGNPLDILAPSHCARTPQPGGGYDNCFGGTSAASPYAAGVAAQILSLRPGTSPAALRNALMTTGRPITDVNQITRNRIDAVQAYQALAGGSGPCVPDADTLCIDGAPGDRRFKLEVNWRTPQGSSGVGGAVPMSSLGIGRGGAFWFFNPANPEMLVKVLNGCPVNSSYWVFFAATTNVEFTLTVTDTQRGNTRTYSNPLGNPADPVQDTAALPTCP